MGAKGTPFHKTVREGQQDRLMVSTFNLSAQLGKVKYKMLHCIALIRMGKLLWCGCGSWCFWFRLGSTCYDASECLSPKVWFSPSLQYVTYRQSFGNPKIQLSMRMNWLMRVTCGGACENVHVPQCTHSYHDVCHVCCLHMV